MAEVILNSGVRIEEMESVLILKSAIGKLQCGKIIQRRESV
jgi:hypothetical protein